jgi:hypothetical protein
MLTSTSVPGATATAGAWAASAGRGMGRDDMAQPQWVNDGLNIKGLIGGYNRLVNLTLFPIG